MKRYINGNCSKAHCLNYCCYLRRGEYEISDSLVKRLQDAVQNKPEEFKPEYRKIVKELIENENFIETNRLGKKCLKIDTTKHGIPDALSSMRYPCIFLANPENYENKNKECMIYSRRFSFCRNTTTKDCLPGIFV
jgi:hypothetical protein